MIFNITDLENIGVSGSTLPAPQRERIVWEAAKDPVGLSISRLSVVTNIDVEAVKRIVLRLHSEGLLSRKPRGARARASLFDAYSLHYAIEVEDHGSRLRS